MRETNAAIYKKPYCFSDNDLTAAVQIFSVSVLASISPNIPTAFIPAKAGL